jgi:C-terminal processing protease CtpA/Prc
VDQDAPAVEVENPHGVLCVTIRRFTGGPEDDARLGEWARNGASHFSYERIVVDLRGNFGGSDAYMLEWIRTVRAGSHVRMVRGRGAAGLVELDRADRGTR